MGLLHLQVGDSDWRSEDDLEPEEDTLIELNTNIVNQGFCI